MSVILRTRPVVQTWSDFDRVFDSVFGLPGSTGPGSMAVNARELEDRYVVEAELPGYSEQEVEVRLDERLLVIEAKKQEEPAQENPETPRYLIRERAVGELRRSFSLPKDADAERIEAQYSHGLLTLSIHKAEKLNRRIDIQRG